MLNLRLLFCLIAFSATTITIAQNDKEGSSDHPLLQRFDRSYIYDYEETSFDAFSLATGKETSGKISNVKQLEGKVYRIFYVLPTDAGSNYEIFSNYKNALKAKGAEILFECKNKAECGKYFWDNIPSKHLMPAYFSEELAYLSAKFSKNGKAYYISVTAGYGLSEQGYEIQVVEVDEMNQQITLDGIEAALKEKGKISLYGILFDTGSDVLKSSSKAEISLVADYLKKHEDKKVYVVGHTDNTGDFGKNKDLSERRAQTVVNTLVKDYGISANRLIAVGVGPASPVAKNTSEEGRKMNRRVEIVLNEQ